MCTIEAVPANETVAGNSTTSAPSNGQLRQQHSLDSQHTTSDMAGKAPIHTDEHRAQATPTPDHNHNVSRHVSDGGGGGGGEMAETGDSSAVEKSSQVLTQVGLDPAWQPPQEANVHHAGRVPAMHNGPKYGTGGKKYIAPQQNDEMMDSSTFTLDWRFINRISVLQMAAATVSLVCMVGAMWGGANRTSTYTGCSWSIFLLLSAVSGVLAAKRRSYAYGIAFLVTMCFQTFMNWSTLCFVVYIGYTIDERSKAYYTGQGHSLLMTITLVEIGALCVCVVTSTLGAVAGCKGFGRLLSRDQI